MSFPRILVRAFVPAALAAALTLLAACGQKGALYLPTTPAAAERATLPQTLKPGSANPPPSAPLDPAGSPSPVPGTGTASPVRIP